MALGKKPEGMLARAGLCVLLGVLQGWAVAWPFGVEAVSWSGWSVTSVWWPEAGRPFPLLQLGAMAGWLWMVVRMPTMRGAVTAGWLFGTGWLMGVFWWLYVSMHTHGGLSSVVAALAVWALAATLAAYVATVSGIFWRVSLLSNGFSAIYFGAIWALSEWARGTWLTGFPWGAVGYTHVDSLGWLAPWMGVYGMSGVAAGLAAWLAMRWAQGAWCAAAATLSVVALCAAGPYLETWAPEWTDSTGSTQVVLLQGNIAQDEKFDTLTGVEQALDWYGPKLWGQNKPNVQSDHDAWPAGALVVAPETAVPLLPQTIEMTRWKGWLSALAAGQHAAVTGLPLGTAAEGYSNSVWALTPQSAHVALNALAQGQLPHEWPQTEIDGPSATHSASTVYRYDKHHLVPFGEFVPPFFRWFVDLMRIPLGDFNRGLLGQPPFEWAGQRFAPNICYEDLFGEELAQSFASASTAPTVLVNVSNLAWFGNTVALDQHLHISRLRSKELARPMVRATNTGATVVVNHHGEVVLAAPRLERAVLQGAVEGRAGLTPFAWWASRWGQWPVVALALTLVAWGAWKHRRLRRARARTLQQARAAPA